MPEQHAIDADADIAAIDGDFTMSPARRRFDHDAIPVMVLDLARFAGYCVRCEISSMSNTSMPAGMPGLPS